MKKALALFLTIVICFGLFACGNKTDTTNGGTTPAGSGQSSQTDVATSPAGGDQSTPSGSEQPTPSGGESSGGGGGAATQTGGLQGYLDDEVDHYARDTYKIAFLTTEFNTLQQHWFEGLQAFEQRLNVNVTSLSADSNKETFLSNIELIATQGYDGALIACMFEIQERATELLYELGIPWICFINMLLDQNDQTVAPCVVLDQYESGQKTMQWLIDNYKEYMGDIDTSKIGGITTGFTVMADHAMRAAGQRDIFEQTFPGCPFFELDTASAGFTGADVVSAQAAFELVGATVSANPKVEYWLVTGTAEAYGPGSARALESLGKSTENALVCVVSSGANIVDWESMSPDTESINVACLLISDVLYAAPALSGIIALIDGRVTYDKLWLEKTPQNYRYGNNFGVWEAETQIITRWNYQEIIAEVNSIAET